MSSTKNKVRSGAMHMTQEELAVQRAKALSRRVRAAHKAVDREIERTKKPHMIVWEWGVTPGVPSYSLVEVKS